MGFTPVDVHTDVCKLNPSGVGPDDVIPPGQQNNSPTVATIKQRARLKRRRHAMYPEVLGHREEVALWKRVYDTLSGKNDGAAPANSVYLPGLRLV